MAQLHLHVHHLMRCILAEAAQEAGVVDRLQLKVGINGAEPWTDEMRQKIEELLNVNTALISMDCVRLQVPVWLWIVFITRVLHVYEDYFYPEVLNPADHTPCADGETENWYLQHLPKKVCRYFVTEPKT